MKLFVALLAPALMSAALADEPIDEIDPGTLRIDIGRLGVINAKSQEIWQKMRSDVDRANYDDPAMMSSNLRQTVWEYNEVREILCQDRFLVAQSCGEPYVPKWMFESSRTIPSLEELQSRQSEVAERVVSLWDAACERLKKVIDDRDSMPYCSVE